MIQASFAQDCPACSRQLRVRRAYAGQRVICQHCKAEFVASESFSRHISADVWRSSLLQRADELLRRLTYA